MGKFTEALADFDRAIALDDKYAFAWPSWGDLSADGPIQAEALVRLSTRAIAAMRRMLLPLQSWGDLSADGRFTEALADLPPSPWMRAPLSWSWVFVGAKPKSADEPL